MNLNAHWMPFTDHKAFGKNPRMVKSSSGMFWRTNNGNELLDMTAGLWCTNLGHSPRKVAEAIYQAAKRLGYAPSFNIGHPAAFEFAERLTALSPDPLNHIFFTNSGSEAIDTALKIALAYQTARGQAGKKMFITRERAYHGVNFGGTMLGGISVNTRAFGRWAAVDYLPHTLDIERNAFSRGLPEFGIEKADALDNLINLHGAENIAAVLVEPIAGAGGVIIPPAGYLQRLREICNKHDVLLILDEVVCAFGRVGSFTASIEFDVIPDMFTSAKGLTSGAAPMGAVFCSDHIYDTVINNCEGGIEFWHGYTYSAHPIACAAGLACLDIYLEESLFIRANQGIGQYFEDALHSLRDLPGLIDIRNYGLLGALEFAPQPDKAPAGTRIFAEAWENGLMIRGAGNSIILSPPLIIEEHHIDEFIEKIRISVNAVM